MPNDKEICQRCEKCKKKLVGDIELAGMGCGSHRVVLLFRETPDRNWIQCDGCNRLLCKNCCEKPKSGYCNSCFIKVHIPERTEVFAKGGKR